MRALLPLLLCVGCSAPVADYSGQFVPVIAVACGVATVGVDAAPVTPSDECQTCGGKGRLPIRDTGRFEDCPDCDANPPLTSLSPPPPAEPQYAGQDAPAVEAVEWLTWPEASALSKETGRPVLVLQKFRDPKADAACLPCQRLKRTLEDDVVLAVFAGQGIPCLGYAEDWQSGPPTAPTIAYVSPGAAPSDKVQSLSGFRVAPADAFLEDLTEWIENVRSK
jgi:hypothetical protein